jgi:hypothetical protein
VLIISVNIIILLPCGPSDFTFDYFGGVGRGRCGKDRLGDRCSVCTTGVGESDNCHVASLDNYDEHQINVEINSVVLKMPVLERGYVPQILVGGSMLRA